MSPADSNQEVLSILLFDPFAMKTSSEISLKGFKLSSANKSVASDGGSSLNGLGKQIFFAG